MEQEIIINKELNEIPHISHFIEKLGSSLNLSPQIIMGIDLAVEEIISTIIQNSDQTSTNELKFYTKVNPGILTLQIIDRGSPFDPFQKVDTSNKVELEERLTKGLGHFLIHRTMDEVSYETINGLNTLTLSKRLDTKFEPEASLSTNICKVDGIIVLDIKGRLDTANAREFSLTIQPLLKEEKSNIIINCEQMSYISSSGLRNFLLLQKNVQKTQGSLIIEAMQPEIKQIFEMTGCTSLFHIR